MNAITALFSAVYAWGLQLPPAGLYLFVLAWLFVESTGFPISDEPLLLLAGYLTTTGRLNLALTVALALVGKVAASCLAYWIGHYIILEGFARPATQPQRRLGRWLYYLRPTRAFVLATEDLFRRYGVWGVFVGRLVPVVRSFISYPAGAARMRFPVFLAATTLGSLLWIVIWTTLGAILGKSYQTALTQWGSVGWIVLGVVVVALVALWLLAHRQAERYGERLALRQATPVRRTMRAATAPTNAPATRRSPARVQRRRRRMGR